MSKSNLKWLGLVVILVVMVHFASSESDTGINADSNVSYANAATESEESSEPMTSSEKEQESQKTSIKEDNAVKEAQDTPQAVIEEESVPLIETPENTTVSAAVPKAAALSSSASTRPARTHNTSTSDSLAKTIVENVDQQALANTIAATENNIVTYKAVKTQIVTSAGVKIADTAIKAKQEARKEISKDIVSNTDKLNQAIKDLTAEIKKEQ